MAKSLSVAPAKKRSRIKLGLLALNVLLLVGLATTSVYFFKQYNDIQKEQKLTQDQKNEKLVAEVDKVFDVPAYKDEKPTVFLIRDPNQLSSGTDFEKQIKQIFPDVKTDDYILVYQKSGQVLQYRPSDKKVVKTAQLTVKKDVNVQMLGASDRITAVERTLTEKIASGLKITNRDAATGTYATTTVVDLSGTQADAAKQIAEAIGGIVGALPAGETAATGVDIVIVLGAPVAP